MTTTPTTSRARRGLRLRLRHRFVLTLLVAAVLPVAAAATLAVRLVAANLERGVRAETLRTRDVGLQLLLRHVQEIFEEAGRVAASPRLVDALAKGPDATRELLAAWDEQLPSGRVAIAGPDGRVIARREIGHAGIRPLADGAESIRRALGWERRIALERVQAADEAGRAQLVARAAMPIVDDRFRLRGAIVLTVPLDAAFVDLIKAELAADVVVYAGTEPVASSIPGPDGDRRPGFQPPPGALAELSAGRPVLTTIEYEGRPYAAGFVELKADDGHAVGLVAFAAPEDHVAEARRAAWRSLALGAALALLLALLLAAVLTTTLTRPLGRLHAAALAIARGDLDVDVRRETGDEIGDLADALMAMTRAVRDNQDRLAARMREITTLHEIGRAVSSVIGLDDVLRRIVDEMTAVLAADRTALLFAGDAGLQIGAAVRIEDGYPLRQLCQLLYWWDGPLRLTDIAAAPELAEAAQEAGLRGSLLAVPLEQKDDILGLLLVNREDRPFSETDLRLVATLADHAATAIQNARLYEAVQRASEELERKVVERTAELTAANGELARLLYELQQAQAQLVLSERMAGLGVLVAGVAHEVNSPAGAIQGAIDAIGDNVDRLVARSRELVEMEMSPEDRLAFFELAASLTPRLSQARIEAPAALRRTAREMAARAVDEGLPPGAQTEGACRTLAEIGAAEALPSLLPLALRHGLGPLVAYLEQYAWLHRNIYAIRTAIARITRLVGALKGYSHLDQAKIARSDVHEGIENTLIILHHELSRGILVGRHFESLPPIPVYVDELNQVWTNLIQNAAQAIESDPGRAQPGQPGQIDIETRLLDGGDEVEVVVQDNGPGIPDDVKGRIFEPFFTTKKAGQGTGLGLGIAQKIIDKHGGRIEVVSRPGCTRFSVRLKVSGPPAYLATAAVEGATGEGGHAGDARHANDGGTRAHAG